MNFELFIASRFFKKNDKNFSKPLIKIAVSSIAIGVAVMILSISILLGFQKEVRKKIVGFGSHILITSYSSNSATSNTPIQTDESWIADIKKIDGIKHLQAYALKGGLIKTEEQIQGFIFKGLEKNFNSDFFKDNLLEGKLFDQRIPNSNEVLISSLLARKLKVKIGDKLRCYFPSDSSYRARAFLVCGIYQTGLKEFDEKYIIGDLSQVQKLNHWDANQAEGIEILIKDFSHLKEIASEVYDLTNYDLNTTTILENQPSLFSWLSLLNTNVMIILILMALVSIASIISTLLVMIFEKSSMIGILKTLGCTNISIRRIFLYKSSLIIGKGILFGFLIALLLCLLQHQFHLIKLDSESYFMSYVPIDLNIWTFLLTCLASFSICICALLIPTVMISKIEPAKSIRFE